MLRRDPIYFIVAFIEGGAVMSVELSGAKMIAPFYGTSLYVWASVLSVTLAGLAVGYYVGGLAATNPATEKTLMIVLLSAAVLIAAMPILAQNGMALWQGLPLKWASLFSAMMFLMPPLIFLGMVSPLLIQILSNKYGVAGKAAGTVYGISTLGGILMTLLTGFYLLPLLGIKLSVIMTAVGLLFSMAILFFGKKLAP